MAFFEQNNRAIRRLVQKFSGYPIDIDAESLRAWIRQFDEEHWSLALKLLNWINYYSNPRVCREMLDFYQQIQARGLNITNSYFAPFCRAGHSGEIILERFRYVNNFKRTGFDDRFIHVSELNMLYNVRNSTFFFIEDFIGTGNQTIEMWNRVSDFVPPGNECILFVITGHDEGITHVESNTPLEVICNRRIYENTKTFSPNNTYFTNEEKDTIREYCERVKNWPEGYGNCQSNVIFYYRAPNNTISIIRSNNTNINWSALFIRNP